MVRKNIFIFLMSWEKINKSNKKRKSQKEIKIKQMGSGGVIAIMWCE